MRGTLAGADEEAPRRRLRLHLHDPPARSVVPLNVVVLAHAVGVQDAQHAPRRREAAYVPLAPPVPTPTGSSPDLDGTRVKPSRRRLVGCVGGVGGLRRRRGESARAAERKGRAGAPQGSRKGLGVERCCIGAPSQNDEIEPLGLWSATQRVRVRRLPVLQPWLSAEGLSALSPPRTRGERSVFSTGHCKLWY